MTVTQLVNGKSTIILAVVTIVMDNYSYKKKKPVSSHRNVKHQLLKVSQESLKRNFCW